MPDPSERIGHISQLPPTDFRIIMACSTCRLAGVQSPIPWIHNLDYWEAMEKKLNLLRKENSRPPAFLMTYDTWVNSFPSHRTDRLYLILTREVTRLVQIGPFSYLIPYLGDGFYVSAVVSFCLTRNVGTLFVLGGLLLFEHALTSNYLHTVYLFCPKSCSDCILFGGEEEKKTWSQFNRGMFQRESVSVSSSPPTDSESKMTDSIVSFPSSSSPSKSYPSSSSWWKSCWKRPKKQKTVSIQPTSSGPQPDPVSFFQTWTRI